MEDNINYDIKKSLNDIKELNNGDSIPLLKIEIINNEDSIGIIGHVNTILEGIACIERENLIAISNSIIAMFDSEIICAIAEINDIYEVAMVCLDKNNDEIQINIVINDIFNNIIYESEGIKSQIDFYSKKIENDINKLIRVNFDESSNHSYKLLFKKENNKWYYKNFIRNILFPLNFQKENIINILNSESYNFLLNEIKKYTSKIKVNEVLISFNYDNQEIKDLIINNVK